MVDIKYSKNYYVKGTHNILCAQCQRKIKFKDAIKDYKGHFVLC